MQPPTMPKQVQAFLGLVGYYRKFIKGFAKIAKPLTMLTQQQVKFEWTPTHHTTFVHLKRGHYTGTHTMLPKSKKGTLSTQMPLTMHAEHNSHMNMMEWNFL